MITRLRIEKLQGVSGADALAEGAHRPSYRVSRHALTRYLAPAENEYGRIQTQVFHWERDTFVARWDGTKPRLTWYDNHWVWAPKSKIVQLPQG